MNLGPVRARWGGETSARPGIRSKAVALTTKRHLQLNHPSRLVWMPHDIDRPDAFHAHEKANLPPPNVIMSNRDNGHAHAAYLLAEPVAAHSAARLRPLGFYAAVERGIARSRPGYGDARKLP